MSTEAEMYNLQNIEGGAAWWLRFFILVGLGQQFQAPLSLQSHLLLGSILALLASGLYEKAKARTAAEAGSLPVPVCLFGRELSLWAQSCVAAALMIWVIHQKTPIVRLCILSVCWTLIAVIIAFDDSDTHALFPFPEFHYQAKLLLGLCVYSTFYHSHRGLKDWDTYIELAFKALRAGRTYYDRTTQRGIRPSDLDAAERRAHAARGAGPLSPDVEDRERQYAQWSCGIEYTELQGDQIRLMKIIDGESEDMECSLAHFSMAEVDRTYTALSYHWGTDVQDCHIIVDGRRVSVPANMVKALREVQQHGLTRIWVDVLCINQQDLVERSAQLLRMGSIFRNAKKVVAWVGPTDPAAETVMSMLMENAITDGPHPPTTIICPRDDKYSFIGRAFWRRVWIVQEIANAMEVVFACANKLASLEQIRGLVNAELDVESNLEWQRFVGNLQLVKEILDIKDRRFKDIGLLELILKTCNSEATVRHDKVFSLLGLATDQHHFMRHPPDYSLSTDETSLLMTRSFIGSLKSLDLILVGPHKMASSTLPSWCPDYFHADKTPLNRYMVEYLGKHDFRYRLGVQGHFWTATASSEAEEGKNLWWVDGNVLKVRAVHIGKIDGVNVTTMGNEQETFTLHRENTGASRKRGRTGQAREYATYDGMTRVFLVYDRKYESYTSAPLALGVLYSSLYKGYAALAGEGTDADFVFRWLQNNRNVLIHGTSLHDRSFWSTKRILGNFIKAIGRKEAHVTTMLDYNHLSKVIAQILREGLHLITLEEGQVGWADPRAGLHDDVFLLSGCSVPVVLRREPGSRQYTVVGRAYIDEYMDGTKWTQARDGHSQADGGPRTMEIEIC